MGGKTNRANYYLARSQYSNDLTTLVEVDHISADKYKQTATTWVNRSAELGKIKASTQFEMAVLRLLALLKWDEQLYGTYTYEK